MKYPGKGDTNELQQSEVKGGLKNIAVSPLGETSIEYNGDSMVTQIEEGLEKEEGLISRKGLKVPLMKNQPHYSEITMGQPELKGGPSGQPEAKGGATHADFHSQGEESIVNSDLMEATLVPIGKGTPDQGTEYQWEALEARSCVPALPVVAGVGEGVEMIANHTHSTTTQDNLKMEYINSQEMLDFGNQTLKTHLLEEREGEKEGLNKQPINEVIQEMIIGCDCTLEQKSKVGDLLGKYRELLITSLTPEFKGGNALFQPHKITLRHEDPIWTPQFQMGKREREILEEMVNEQYKAGVIEPSTTTKYNSPVLIVPK